MSFLFLKISRCNGFLIPKRPFPPLNKIRWKKTQMLSLLFYCLFAQVVIFAHKHQCHDNIVSEFYLQCVNSIKHNIVGNPQPFILFNYKTGCGIFIILQCAVLVNLKLGLLIVCIMK